MDDRGLARAVGTVHAPSGLSPQAVSSEAAHQAQIVGITGQRWKPSEAQAETLISALTGFREGGSEWQHNGDCVGADALAGAIWRNLGGRVHLHPPTIRSKRAFQPFSIQSAARPYLDRNRDIVDETDVLIALPQEEFEQERSGTWATVRYARTLRRPIMVIWPSGRWTVENWPRCQYCDGTGDVHRIDGEWLGPCHCGATPQALEASQGRDAARGSIAEGDDIAVRAADAPNQGHSA